MRVINKLAPNSRTARICKRCFLFLSSRWLSIKPHRDERAYHLISNSGCAGQCTYCAIKFAIGPVKSKSLSVLKEEFERGLSLGYRYIRILSSDLKNYGQDTGDTTLELLECLTSSPADFMLSLTYLSPGWIIANFDEFLKILARRKIGKIFTTIQHGSQRVIDLMNRGYDIKKAQNCLRQINQKFPEIRLATSVIAGFPTETQAEVHETLEVLRSIRFMNVFINAYSDRPNTVSSEMPGKIPPEEIKRRCEYLSKNMMGNLVRGFLTDLIFDLTFDFGEGWKKARKKRSLGGNPQSAVGPWK
jgi:tRNA A37 methylthiotransferase MiaB